MRRLYVRFLSYQYTRRLQFPKEQVQKVVVNVKDYKQFIPYVVDSNNKYDVDSNGNGSGTGYMTVNFQAFEETVDCKVDFSKDHVTAKCSNNLFKYLSCTWKFVDVASAYQKKRICEVQMSLDYEFHNFLYNQVSSLFNKELSRLMMQSFEKRLKQIK